MFNDIITRIKGVFTKPEPVEQSPRLSREKEMAMCGYFDALNAYYKDHTDDNHKAVQAASKASKAAK